MEVVSPSPSKDDYHFKRDYCTRHGVKEYWIVDLFKKKVTLSA
ncbi:MAG: Uma2 family endonuclease [Clostridiales bacterium]|nr:Uma2 family endonuclease [Clostridiales bacterium]